MEVHRILGKGLLEIVYKDSIKYEFKTKKFLCPLGLIINFGENSLVTKRVIL
jgi:hypothetical protein